MSLKDKLFPLGVLAALVLVGLGVGYEGIKNERTRKEQERINDSLLHTPLLDSLRTRQMLKEVLIPNYDPFADWMGGNYYDSILDSMLIEDQKGWYL